jgi:hypothetical protein
LVGRREVSNVEGSVGFRGCKGLQPSRVRNDYWSLDQDPARFRTQRISA